MTDEDIQLLAQHGWEVIDPTINLIKHTTSGTVADGFIAEMVVQLLTSSITPDITPTNDPIQVERRRTASS